MSDPKVIYLGPECEDEFCDGRTWADHVAWPDCDCNHKPVRYNIGSDYDAALAREAESCRSYDSLVDRSNRRGEANEAREAALQALSVTNIMLDVVPGEDGMGEEVYAKSVHDVEVMLSQFSEDIEASQDREAALREELEAIKKVKNFSDAVACVFDMLKFAAANTSCKEWDEQLEDLAQDVIEFAPEYKKQWKDICALQQRLTVAEKRVDIMGDLLLAARPMIPRRKFGSKNYQWHLEVIDALKPAEEGEGS